jgi:hypothetical protein
VTYAGRMHLGGDANDSRYRGLCGVAATSVGILYVIIRAMWKLSECDNRNEINSLGVTFMSECDSLCQCGKC